MAKGKGVRRMRRRLIAAAAAAWALASALLLHEARGMSAERRFCAYTASLERKAPAAAGELVFETGAFEIDASNAGEGYITARCKTEPRGKIKLIITTPRGTDYSYDLEYKSGGGYEIFPLTEGGGVYGVGIYSNTAADSYRAALYCRVDADISGEGAFLYPSKAVCFSAEGLAAASAARLTGGCASAREKISVLYNWVAKNLEYDGELAASVEGGYVSDADRTVAKGSGICLDYAVLLTAMLRCCGVPARLELGSACGQYHAWTAAYTGDGWMILDPTWGVRAPFAWPGAAADLGLYTAQQTY